MKQRLKTVMGDAKIWSRICGFFVPAVFPPVHIGILYYFWHKYSRHVDRHYCSCSCWDTVFKGTYETGIASYKHVYFNATSNSLKMWVLTVLCVLVLYECVRHLVSLALARSLRPSMLLLFASSLFAHYYSWWAYFNYWNDDFYSQWDHQLFFSLTEACSTALVVDLADSRTRVTPRKALGITGIALLHVLAAGWDQFVENVVQGRGFSHQVIRDVCFMVPDVLHVCVPLVLLLRSRQDAAGCLFDADVRRELTAVAALVVIGLYVSSFL
ncbi:uncharacterized protein LOC134528435 [Bacillus rossius redtenbacheri]|uniref:uncharacterized protein LOC134528435 n=1 Tax=Bacillus rossius redtenbacheri TaxID=93214 RepID=UPI002FDE97A4